MASSIRCLRTPEDFQLPFEPFGPHEWFDKACEEGFRTYGELIRTGVPPQDARGVLPLATSVSIIAKFNLRTLSEMAKVRLCTRTQGEYQDVFREMRARVVEVHPWVDEHRFIEVHCVAQGTCAFPRYGRKECKFYRGWMDLDINKEGLRTVFWRRRSKRPCRSLSMGGRCDRLPDAIAQLRMRRRAMPRRCPTTARRAADLSLLELRLPLLQLAVRLPPGRAQGGAGVIILDLDNCISDDGWRISRILPAGTPHRHHAYHSLLAWDRYVPDDIIERANRAHERIAILTSRPQMYRPATEEWLRRNGVRYSALLMRDNVDNRHSIDVKYQQVQWLLSGEYGPASVSAISMAYDDRSEIVDMYREEFGLRVTQHSIHQIPYPL
jgi:hypothetical protein